MYLVDLISGLVVAGADAYSRIGMDTVLCTLRIPLVINHS